MSPSSALRAVSLACLVSWIGLLCHSARTPEYSFPWAFLAAPRYDVTFLVWELAVGAGMLAMGLAFLRASSRLAERLEGNGAAWRLSLAAGALASVVGGMLALLGSGNLALVVAGAALAGLGFAFYVNVWLPWFLRPAEGGVFAASFLALPVSALLCAALLALQPVPAFVLIALLPLISYLCARATTSLGEKTDGPCADGGGKEGPSGLGGSACGFAPQAITLLFTLTGTAFFMGVIGFGHDTLPPRVLLVTRACIMAFAALFCAAALFVLNRLGAMRLLWLVCPLILATALLLLPLSHPVALVNALSAVVNGAALCARLGILLFFKELFGKDRAPMAKVRGKCALLMAAGAFARLAGVLMGGMICSVFDLDVTTLAFVALLALYLLSVLIVIAVHKGRASRRELKEMLGSSERELASVRLSALAERYPELSQRELDVLLLMLQNYSNDQMAAELTISRNTVKTHVQHIYAKLGTKTRPELLDLARRLS